MVGKPEGKSPLGRPRCRWANYIQMHLREIGSGGMDWIDLAQNMDQWRALVNTVVNLWVPKNAVKFLSSCTIGASSRRPQLDIVSLLVFLFLDIIHRPGFTRI
jgi:hypothetical protein